MSFSEAIGWFSFGCAIGFFFGYVVRSLRVIDEKVTEVDEIVKEQERKRKEKKHKRRLTDDEDGFVRNPIVMDVALLIVVALTVWAAFASQHASNELENTQGQLAKVSFCNQQYLSRTITALSERSEYAQRQADANVSLQQAQGQFLAVILEEPPANDQRRAAALRTYFDALSEFYKASGQTTSKAERTPYPTNQELSECLN